MTGCIEWEKARYANGYGKVGIGGKTKYAHRVAYELEYGPIPDGMCVMHSCDNPPCINPDHLSVGTHADNVRDKTEKGRTPFGDVHSGAKLTTTQAKAIHADPRPHSVIAEEYRVSRSAVSNLKAGRSWVHATSDGRGGR